MNQELETLFRDGSGFVVMNWTDGSNPVTIKI